MPIHLIPGYDETEKTMSIARQTFDAIVPGDVLTVQAVADGPPGSNLIPVKIRGVRAVILESDILAVRSPQQWKIGEAAMVDGFDPVVIRAIHHDRAWVYQLVQGRDAVIDVSALQPRGLNLRPTGDEERDIASQRGEGWP
jgi:hypothetical protein